MTLADTMQALTMTQDGFANGPSPSGSDSIADFVTVSSVPVPKPEGRDVLVRIGLAVVNPSDIDYIKGKYGAPRQKGVAAGFEAMGEVVAAGDADGEALIGRRVALLVMPPRAGVWAEYATIDRAAAVPLGEGVRDSDGASFIVNPLSAYVMIQLAKARGATGIALTAAASQLCKLMTSLARDEGMKVLALVRRPGDCETLINAGASHALNINAPDYREALTQAVHEAQPTMLFDAVGDQVSVDLFEAMPFGSEWVPYGVLAEQPPRLQSLTNFIFMAKSMKGFWLKQWFETASPEEQAEAAATVQSRFQSGAWRTDVAAEILLVDAPALLADALASGRQGKVMLKP